MCLVSHGASQRGKYSTLRQLPRRAVDLVPNTVADGIAGYCCSSLYWWWWGVWVEEI